MRAGASPTRESGTGRLSLLHPASALTAAAATLTEGIRTRRAVVSGRIGIRNGEHRSAFAAGCPGERTATVGGTCCQRRTRVPQPVGKGFQPCSLLAQVVPVLEQPIKLLDGHSHRVCGYNRGDAIGVITQAFVIEGAYIGYTHLVSPRGMKRTRRLQDGGSASVVSASPIRG